MPVCTIGWTVRLRHMIGLLDHLAINLWGKDFYQSVNSWKTERIFYGK